MRQIICPDCGGTKTTSAAAYDPPQPCDECNGTGKIIGNDIQGRPSWDQYFVAMLPMVKARASCPRRQGGSIIVDENNVLVSTGYNGPPSGLPNCTEDPCPGVNEPSGTTSSCIALHAEHNAIYFAGDRKKYAHTIYCTTRPCMKCALEILQTPIKRVVYLEDYPDDRTLALLEQGGVTLERYQ